MAATASEAVVRYARSISRVDDFMTCLARVCGSNVLSFTLPHSDDIRTHVGTCFAHSFMSIKHELIVASHPEGNLKQNILKKACTDGRRKSKAMR